MNKRIIDGMSAEQIAKGWSNGDCQDALVEYLESLCNPPTKQGEADEDNA